MQECETLTFDLCDGVSISEPKMLISSKERSSERASELAFSQLSPSPRWARSPFRTILGTRLLYQFQDNKAALRKLRCEILQPTGQQG